MRIRRLWAAFACGSFLPIQMRCPEPLERSPTLVFMVATPVRPRGKKPIRARVASSEATPWTRASPHDIAAS